MSFAASTARSLRRIPHLTRGLATAHDLPQSITAPEASAYLSSILSLPPSAAFPPALALQILTHKSYRFVHRIAHAPPYTSAELAQGQASHNGRLGFVGRRAIAAYSAIFLHSALGSAERAHEADFLRGKDIEGKLEALRHANNLGRVVGDKWGVGEVMRHDRQETGREGGFLRIKGLTVEAILGGVFLQHGSPAAQRVYHAHILPALERQLRDPALIEAARVACDAARDVGVVSK